MYIIIDALQECGGDILFWVLFAVAARVITLREERRKWDEYCAERVRRNRNRL